MFEHLKQTFRRLQKYEPGERFGAFHREQKDKPLWVKVVFFVLAFVSFGVGVVLAFIPGPAVLFFAISGALLSTQSRFVARTLDNPYLDRWINRFREATGQYMLSKVGSSGEIDELLARGGTLALLGDQHAGKAGCWVDFFGKPAFTMTLPRKLQRMSGAAFLLTFAERLPRGKGFRLHFENVSSDDFDEAKLNRAIESLVRRYPSQYYWNYNRYKNVVSRRLRGTYQSRRARK